MEITTNHLLQRGLLRKEIKKWEYGDKYLHFLCILLNIFHDFFRLLTEKKKKVIINQNLCSCYAFVVVVSSIRLFVGFVLLEVFFFFLSQIQQQQLTAQNPSLSCITYSVCTSVSVISPVHYVTANSNTIRFSFIFM